LGTLKDKRVLITAGAQGIGKAISEQFIHAGSSIAIHYFTSGPGADEVLQLAEEHSVKAAAIQADLSREEDARECVRKAAEFLGGIDILVNNAGTLVARRRIGEIDAAYWQQVMDINLASAQWVTQEAMPWLLGAAPSSIVNVSSISGRCGGSAGSLAYSAAKGALLAWTRALAGEVGGRGVRVNAVAPGLVLGTHFHATHSTQEAIERTLSRIPLGRAGTPDDVARAVLFLASEYDGFIHGATLDINGGSYCA